MQAALDVTINAGFIVLFPGNVPCLNLLITVDQRMMHSNLYTLFTPEHNTSMLPLSAQEAGTGDAFKVLAFDFNYN